VEKAQRVLPVVILRSGEQTAGFIVDEFLDERDTTVKALGVPPGMAGFTVGGLALEDGSVVPLLNPAALFDRLAALRPVDQAKTGDESHRPAPKILIVDDSITTRSLERSILEAHGYQVRLAVDGVEALQKLGAEPFDLVITDVMMPRMDGFELLQEMKRRKETERIPVIVVTSLERPEEQERGLSLGADAYIVKRKFDQRELLNIVRQIL
jgi:two-component system chemotaxis sensor kinase CheA